MINMANEANKWGHCFNCRKEGHRWAECKWMVPKYRSNSVYTSSYKRYHTVQYGTEVVTHGAEQLVTRHSQEHTLSIVGPDAPVE